MKKKVIWSVMLALFVSLVFLTGNSYAAWECYQKMVITEETVGNANANTNSNASSMYTTDGHLRTGIGVATYQMQSSRDFKYRKHEIIRYFTICEENGKIVSIIERDSR